MAGIDLGMRAPECGLTGMQERLGMRVSCEGRRRAGDAGVEPECESNSECESISECANYFVGLTAIFS